MNDIWNHIIKLKHGEKIIYERSSYNSKNTILSCNKTTPNCEIIEEEVLNNARKR